MKGLKTCYAKLILWLSGFVNVIVFTLTGGYVWLKSENEELKKETKKVFIVVLIFICIDVILSLIYNIYNLSNGSSDFYKFYRTVSTLVSIAKIITYMTFALIAVFSKDTTENKPAEEKESANETK